MSSIKKIHVGLSIEMKISCEKHNHRGNMPCPWLNCSNGIRENEFIDSTFEDTDTPHHYIRKKWSYPDGSERYSWYDKSMPSIFTIYRILQEDSFNINFGSESNNIVYHYTSIQGLDGIINSNSMWMTDFKYMNDYKEISHGVGLVENLVNDLEKNDIYNNKEEYFQIWKRFIKKGIKKRICISCFSVDNGDSLSQWRGYGNNGSGISIGFKSNSTFWDYQPLASLRKVIYDTDEQNRILKNILHTYLTVPDWEENKSRKFISSKKIAKRCISSFYEYITYFKNNSFKDEQEVRWVYKSDKNYLKMAKLKKPKKEFRISNNKIIPYLSSRNIPESKSKYGLKREKLLPIVDIVVGPQKDADLVVCGIKELLKSKGYKNVEVRKSLVPYRA